MYYIVFIILVLFSCINLFFKIDKIKGIYFFSFLLLLFFAGFRYNVGYDYDNYEAIFTGIKFNDFAFVEPLFLIITKVLQFISLDYNFFLFCIAFISIFLKFKFLIKFSVLPLLSILIYYSRIYLNADFGQIRQGLALGMILYSLPFVIDKNLKKFLVIVTAAALIHAAAILFLPIYFFSDRFYKRKTILLTLIIGLFIASIDLKDLLLQIFETVLPAGLAFKLLYYTSNEESIGITFSLILRLLIILISISFYWPIINKNRGFRIVFNIYYLGYLFYLVFNSLPQLGGRGSIYFQQFELLLLPLLFIYSKHKGLKLWFLFFLIFYSFWGIRTILNSVSDDTPYYFEPYESIFKLF